MNIAIFGGSGFIGTNYVKYFQSNDRVKKIYVLDIKFNSELRNFDKVTFIECDVRDTIQHCQIDKLDIIYNFAAVHTTPGHFDYEYYDTNVNGAINICDYAKTLGCEKLVFTSSISVYGPTESEVYETSLPNPQSAYGKSKLMAEKIHSNWASSNSKNKLIIIRPAVVFGVGENGNFTRLAKILKKGFFIFPGRNDTIKACFYVDHLIRKIEYYVGLDLNFTIINGCYNETSTIADIVNTMSEVLDITVKTYKIPYSLLRVISKGLKLFDFINFGFHPERIDKLYRSTNIKTINSDFYSVFEDVKFENGIKDWSEKSNGKMN